MAISQNNLLLIAFLKCSILTNSQTINETYYESFLNMVEANIAASKAYVFPKNNKALLQVEDVSTTYDYGIFDFVIIGGGTTGAVIAARLSENPKFKVLLLEAGGSDTRFSDILGTYHYLYHSEMNWGYNTTSQTTYCHAMLDEQCPVPRGKVIGGCSTLNGGIYSRGTHANFDRWEKLGNKGWSFKDVLPYFKKSEKALFSGADPFYAGRNGPVTVNKIPSTPGVNVTIIEALSEIGVPFIDDYNGVTSKGVAKPQYNLKGNRRMSSSRSYLDPIKDDRKNFDISLNSFVTKLMIDRNTATGAEFVKYGKMYRVKASREVILSAGVINSPQILMLSGIGPKDHLTKHGIKVIKDLPVGKYLQDHVTYIGAVYRFPQVHYNLTEAQKVALYLHENQRPLIGSYELLTQWTLGSPGKDITTNLEMEISLPGGKPSNTARTFQLSPRYASTYNTKPLYDVEFSPSLLQPKSMGTVRLQSSNPVDHPLIDIRGLADPEDLELMYEGLQFLLSLNETKSFRDKGIAFHHVPVPGCDGKSVRFSKNWWYCALRIFSRPQNQSSGTTRMGQNSTTSVVNEKLIVHGFKNLRVADAGIFPETLSGNGAGVCYMIGEKISDVIKAKYVREDHGKKLFSYNKQFL